IFEMLDGLTVGTVLTTKTSLALHDENVLGSTPPRLADANMLPLGNVESAITEPLKLTLIAPPPVLPYVQVATACELMQSKL
ncbi:hypothetical protein, partial [Klebsiella pneumoniae]|uniref:hypothetical protein n=1 Tax=Klebsiella pneumoniae TaxID=573 RepID=UPI001C6FAAAA